MKRLSSLTYKTIELNHGTLTYAVDINIENTQKVVDITQNETCGEVYIIEYSGHDTLVTIPEQIEGYPVVAVGKKAFLSNKSIKEVMLPKTISEIGDFCFARCTGLKKVGLPYKAF